MSFDWLELLPLAEELSQNNGEPKLRTAINRAYYAAFHFSRSFLESHFPLQASQRIKGKNMHEETYIKMKNYPNQYVKKIGRKLQALCSNRIDVDYYEDADINKKNVEGSIELAKEVIRLEKEYKP